VSYLLESDPELRDGLARFGEDLRRCRLRAGMSQAGLAARSGVAQSTISRLERGLAAHASVMKLVKLHAAMGQAFPLAYCPHEHACAWQSARGVRRISWLDDW